MEGSRAGEAGCRPMKLNVLTLAYKTPHGGLVKANHIKREAWNMLVYNPSLVALGFFWVQNLIESKSQLRRHAQYVSGRHWGGFEG